MTEHGPEEESLRTVPLSLSGGDENAIWPELPLDAKVKLVAGSGRPRRVCSPVAGAHETYRPGLRTSHLGRGFSFGPW